MIRVMANTPHRSIETLFYQEWEVPVEHIVEWNKVSKWDIGKFVMFDDGSRLFAKILHASNRIVVTSAGQFRKADIVHCAIPKDPTTTIYGCDMREVHPLVRPYTEYEKAVGMKYISDPKDKSIKLTKRIRMFTIDELKKEAEKDVSYTAKDFYNTLKVAASVANVDGRNFWKAFKVMGIIHGDVNVDKAEDDFRSKLIGPPVNGRPQIGTMDEVKGLPAQRVFGVEETEYEES